MAKTIKTRIKNRYDSLTNWSKDGVELLHGEIALIKVETQQIDKDTGDITTVPAFLMKVGENDVNGNPKAFSALPWLSAIAADVYDWAKLDSAEDIPVKILINSTETEDTLGGWLKTTNDKTSANAASISAIDGNYVRFNSTDSTLYVGKSGVEEIIFDCGGAPIVE